MSRFPIKAEIHEGGGRARLLATIRCGARGCGVAFTVSAQTKETLLPPEVLAKKFRLAGWRVGAREADDRCPAHVAGERKRAAYCRIAGVERRKEPTMPIEPAPKRAPAPPREATIADRHRVMDALAEHYDTNAQHYSQSWTDERLAQKLDVPRAWVTDIRVQWFGVNAGNEAQVKRSADIAQLERKIAQAMDTLAGLETELQQLKEGG